MMPNDTTKIIIKAGTVIGALAVIVPAVDSVWTELHELRTGAALAHELSLDSGPRTTAADVADIYLRGQRDKLCELCRAKLVKDKQTHCHPCSE